MTGTVATESVSATPPTGKASTASSRRLQRRPMGAPPSIHSYREILAGSAFVRKMDKPLRLIGLALSRGSHYNALSRLHGSRRSDRVLSPIPNGLGEGLCFLSRLEQIYLAVAHLPCARMIERAAASTTESPSTSPSLARLR